MQVNYTEVMEKMRVLVPVMKKVDDETLTAWIMLAESLICCERFGKNLSQALALYTLHIMFQQGAFKQTNKLEDYGRKVAQYALTGEYQITYKHDESMNTSQGYDATPWGKMFKILNRKHGGGFGLVGGLHRNCGGRFLNGL